MRVQLVDPSAFTPPYDRALAAALARRGLGVELLTSRVLHGSVAAAEGYEVKEAFYRRTSRRGLDARARLPFKLAEHVPDMMRLRRSLDADVIHWQWLTAPELDTFLLPPARPRVLTAHYVAGKEAGRRELWAARRMFGAMDAVIAHSRHTAERLQEVAGVPEERVRVIPHGAFDYMTRLPGEKPLPAELEGAEGPVILFFGLLRPYKGLDVLLEAFAGLEGAELWIAGKPRMDVAPLREKAARAAGTVRFVPRFITDDEIPALMRRADVLVLPYLEAEHSGVFYTGLAFGKPMVVSSVGGFTEVAREHGAARLVPPGDADALAAALDGLVGDSGAREKLAAAARAAAGGPYSWDAIAAQTAELYSELTAGGEMIRPVRKALFWTSAGLIAYTHAGYPLALKALAALRGARPEPFPEPAELPSVSLIIAAFDEAEVIERKVENALALDYPRERLEIIVASDGSEDETVKLARGAGADQVLDLPRGGKLSAQNAAAQDAKGEVLAFSDANSWWEPGALRRLVAALGDPKVGYVCGDVAFDDPGGDNQEGVYWRYEMAVRELESSLGGITAGNGAIYAVRAGDYLVLEPGSSHDLAFPFRMAKRGRRSVYVPEASARERVVPSLEGEWRRKRRMMIGLWDIVIGEGMLDPRGYPPLFAFEVFSHRALRYASPFLHVLLAVATLGLAGRGGVYRLSALAHGAVGVAAALADRLPSGPTRLARYYVLVTASIAAGLWDRLRGGSRGTWDKAEGTR